MGTYDRWSDKVSGRGVTLELYTGCAFSGSVAAQHVVVLPVRARMYHRIYICIWDGLCRRVGAGVTLTRLGGCAIC